MATRSLNRVQLIGNLTRDPELRYTQTGTAVGTFTVATNRTYTDSNNNTVETAEFTPVVAWAKLGEICSQLLNKGSKVFIEGRLQTSSWDDKETGKTMRRTEVVATDMIVLNSTGGGNNNNGETPATGNSSDMSETMDTDLDFENMDFDSDSSSDDSKKSTDSTEDTPADDSTDADASSDSSSDDGKTPF